MRAPIFWKDRNIISTALVPASCLYQHIAVKRKKEIMPRKLPVPVICVGNVVAGGAGKTPTALAIGAMLKTQGMEAHFLTRGYKGKLKGPVQVDPAIHTAADVGDEALLLAQVLPTWVSQDRVAGGQAAVKAGAECIVMDDGYQNPSLHKDLNLLVIDGIYGFGNGRMLPAGPLREPVKDAVGRAHAVIFFGQDTVQALKHISPYKTVLHANLRPSSANTLLHGKAVVAFAGIAQPNKFYRTLNEMGCRVERMVSFADHHLFSRREIEALLAQAKKLDGLLVTTTKDYVRLPKDLRVNILPVQVEAVFEDPDAVWRAIFP